MVLAIGCEGVAQLPTPSVPNYKLFDFFLPSDLTTLLIQKFMQNILLCYSLLYQCKFFKNGLNLIIFAQFFLNKTNG